MRRTDNSRCLLSRLAWCFGGGRQSVEQSSPLHFWIGVIVFISNHSRILKWRWRQNRLWKRCQIQPPPPNLNNLEYYSAVQSHLISLVRNSLCLHSLPVLVLKLVDLRLASCWSIDPSFPFFLCHLFHPTSTWVYDWKLAESTWAFWDTNSNNIVCETERRESEDAISFLIPKSMLPLCSRQSSQTSSSSSEILSC